MRWDRWPAGLRTTSTTPSRPWRSIQSHCSSTQPVSTPLPTNAPRVLVNMLPLPVGGQLDQPDDNCNLDYVPHRSRPLAITYALSNSFGFGGTNAALLFKRYEA